MNELIINNVVVTKAEAVEMMKDAIKKADKKGYRPGHRIENIWGYFWEMIEKKVNASVNYGDIAKLKKLINANELIFNTL